MNWMIELSVLLLLTSATGSVVLLLWHAVCRMLEGSGFYNLMYLMLKYVMLFFLIPVIYVWFSWSSWNIGTFGGRLFIPTPTLSNWAQGFLTIWIIGVICASIYYLYTGRQFQLRVEKATSAGNDKRQVFEDVCQEIEINPKRFRICEYPKMPVPFLTGIFQPRIIIPEEMNDAKELRIAFFHELMHSKHRDLIWKRMIIWIQVTQWFNPCVWWLLILFDRWCEYACDTEVCQKLDRKIYFDVILKTAERVSGILGVYSVYLFERKSEIRLRVEHMKMMKDRPKRSAGMMRAACVMLLLIGWISVYAVTSVMAEQYIEVFHDTKVKVEEEYEPIPEYEEMVRTEFGSHIREEEGEVTVYLIDDGTIYNLQWSVENNIAKQSPSVYISPGTNITVMMHSTPVNAEVEIGIMNQQGYMSYIRGSNFISHTFTDLPFGNYRVYVLNESGGTVKVSGSYIVE